MPQLEPANQTIDNQLSRDASAAAWGIWKSRSKRNSQLWLLGEWAQNRLGTPILEEGASEELRDLARISRLGMCRVVVNTFKRGLSVVGFRSPDEADDDPVWTWWQRNRMDARQQEIHKPALTYGHAFCALLPDDRTGEKARPSFYSPLNAFAEYEEPDDLFPQVAVLTRDTAFGRSAFVVDDTWVTPIAMKKATDGAKTAVGGFTRHGFTITGEPWRHDATYDGRPVCPVVRFVDDASDETGGRNPDRHGIGVVEPIIALNKAMNQVNFDRLVVARYGAHDQKLIIGWSDSKDRLLKLGAAHVGAIDEHPDDVRVERWQASALSPYSELIKELREQVALEAAIPLWAAGSMSNVSTDTAAFIEAAHQRELAIKRESYGEAWEQVLRLAIAMEGGTQPDDGAEVIWRDTNSRSFGGVVDGISKLAAEGVPIEELLPLVPGLTQQTIKSIIKSKRKNEAATFAASILEEKQSSTNNDFD